MVIPLMHNQHTITASFIVSSVFIFLIKQKIFTKYLLDGENTVRMTNKQFAKILISYD